MSNPHDITFPSLLADLLDFLYPPQCQVCGKGFVSSGGNIWLCEQCRHALAELPSPCCAICRSFLPEPDKPCSGCHRRSAITWLYSLGTYDDYYSRLIKAFKYSPKPALGTLLGGMLGRKLREFPHAQTIDAVCAVPIHRQKESRRGFNQAAIIAREAARVLGVEYHEAQLLQTKKNRDQIGMSVAERFRNVQGVYSVSEQFALEGKSVLLVDDVTTSGATLHTAAVVLKDAKVKSVAAATIAVALEEGIDPAAIVEELGERF